MSNHENIQSPILMYRKLIHFRHGSLLRDKDGVIEFWEKKNNLQKHTESGRAA